MKRKQKIILLLSLLICTILLLLSIGKRNKTYSSSVIKTSVQANDISLNYNNETVKVPITIQNIQNDSETISYQYTIHVDTVSSSISATYKDSTIEVPFDEDGNATFSLQSNETITLQDMPVDVSYTLTQENNESYNVSTNENYTNTYKGITKAQNIVTFTNTTTKKVTNPNTYDFISFIALLFIISSILIILLKDTKERNFYANINQ